MKNFWLLIFMAAFCLTADLSIVACDDDDDDDNDTSGDDDDNGDFLEDGYYSGLGMIVTDPDSGMRVLFPDVAALLGQKKSASQSDEGDPATNNNFDHPSAEQSCLKASQETGETWVLATISQLRSFIRGCPETEFDGPCGVFDECPTKECWDDDCNFACALDGPSPRPDGCYVSDFFPPGYCGAWEIGDSIYWSSTLVIIDDDPNEYWWVVGYGAGIIQGHVPTSKEGYRVLCIAQ